MKHFTVPQMFKILSVAVSSPTPQTL